MLDFYILFKTRRLHAVCCLALPVFIELRAWCKELICKVKEGAERSFTKMFLRQARGLNENIQQPLNYVYKYGIIMNIQDVLPASVQLHLAGVRVDVAVGAADGAVHGCLVTRHRTVLPVC